VIIPLFDTIVVASHIGRDGVGNEAMESFRRNAKTVAQHLFAEDFRIHTFDAIAEAGMGFRRTGVSFDRIRLRGHA
jgi:hypothetical protein